MRCLATASLLLQSPAPAKPISQGKPVQTKAWIVPSPHKLGTYGFNLTTLSERKGAQGVVSIHHTD